MNEITVLAVGENLDSVNDFLQSWLEKNDFSMKTIMQITLAVEEIFINVANYAYAPNQGEVTVQCESDRNSKKVIIRFIDGGKPYNPLEREDPDVKLNAESRQIGGLGIFLVKKTMTDLKYEYKDNKNIFSFSKAEG